jgi:hypothetical protein
MSTLAICWTLLLGLLGQQPVPSSAAPTSLNFEVFKTNVQPIFIAKRPGHARCISCHATSEARILILQPLPTGNSNWNETDSRKNFEAVKRVVVPGNLQSPLLTHPLTEEAGGDFFHGGGKHFNSQDDPEWQILKTWVMGQTMKTGN